MIAISRSIRQLIEIRKFAVNMEEVWFVEYDKSKFPGKHITKEECKEKELKCDGSEDEKDEL